ncbi:hypothetical protein [Nocardioides hwasunensis]|uniref:Uncharacterized protein n=1 Tax=Nocardioides hwasunensis TaxID=397258 RepID=A0ABR8MCU1_9ACTN|nr:hypothetical protein [Nocardioides hwasunensis]MBD3913772.1 hypothetical protein [Nocardioides hwasunensis]
MERVLEESLTPPLRDLERAGLEAPRFEDFDWNGDPEYASLMMWGPDGGGTGLSVRRAARLEERVASAADQVQEWAIETHLWGAAPTNWPPCPNHPDTHPLQAVVHDHRAVWLCPADQSVMAAVGEV